MCRASPVLGSLKAVKKDRRIIKFRTTRVVNVDECL